ncbi:hypothetical protein [Actinophytocola sp.]|uniref:hypothetical protein n=1 Tax=Actinophytocola sp. TaxID=1872138 RepID=UPI003C711375
MVLTVERRLGIDLFWSIAWGIVATILLTRLITSKISHERPLTAAAAMWLRELTAPREATTGEGGAVSATRVRVNADRPRKQTRAQRNRARAQATSRQRGKQRNRPRRQETKRGRSGGVRTPTQARA